MSLGLPDSPTEVEALLSSAVSSRASHIRSEIQTMTLANVRRLLETDLELQKFALDPHKAFVRKLVDEVLLNAQQDDAKEGGGKDEGITIEKFDPDDVPKDKKRARKVQENESENGDEEEASQEPREAPKKQKKEKIVKAQKASSGGRDRSSHEVSEGSDVSEGRKVQKVSSKDAGVKSKQDKMIDHLKQVLKACGLNVPPSIYKRAKLEPENKRDSFVRKEMEGILSRHGLSANPTEKEIKAVKRKLAREKDLEGIDTTNIIMEPRGRRNTLQPFPPVYRPPPVVEEQDGEGSDDEAASNDAQSSEGASEGVKNHLDGSESDE